MGFRICRSRPIYAVITIFTLSLILNVDYGVSQSHVSQEAVPKAVPWYESLPAVAMDYKVHVEAGKEDCYFQFVQPGATFYVSFQVHINQSFSFIFHTIWSKPVESAESTHIVLKLIFSMLFFV